MNKARLKTYAPQARRDFIAAVEARAHLLGLSGKGGTLDVAPGERKGDIAVIAGQAWPAKVHEQRERLIRRMQKDGFAQTVEAVAYTWFNRFAALRYMEIHDYLGHGHRVLSSREGGLPEIIAHATDLAAGSSGLPGLNAASVAEMKLAGNQDGELYRLLLVAQCNALSKAMPFLFERIDDESELLLPGNLERTDSVVAKLVEAIPDEDWNEVEVIGWLYQFYISEKKDAVIGKVVKSEDIPAATQLFTPNWIVQYLVQNSVGRLWLMANEHNGAASGLKSQWPYYIEPAEQTPEVQAQLDALIKTRIAEDSPLLPGQGPGVRAIGSLNPETITVLDPACGSGHILVEAYAVMKGIYLERGYPARSIPRLILEKNLYGLDIDDRAAQLAGFALLMKARADDRRLLDGPIKLNVLSLQESASMDLDEFAAHLKPHGIDRTVLGALLDSFAHGKTFGSLIQIPKVLEDGLARLEDGIARVIEAGDVFASAAAQDLMPLVRQAKILAMKFDAVVANPPYMGGTFKLLNEFMKAIYKDESADLFACFIAMNLSIVKKSGLVAMITLQSWMFSSSYEKLREKLLRLRTISSLVHVGFNSFPSLNSKIALACAFVFQPIRVANYKGIYIDLNSASKAANKEEIFLNRDPDSQYSWPQDVFAAIPGMPISYSASSVALDAFRREKLGDIGQTRRGLQTGNSDRFIRCWHEVSVDEVELREVGRLDALDSNKKWFLFNNGGDFRRWFGNIDLVVLWKNDGESIKNFEKSIIPSEKLYFEPAICWSRLTYNFGFRLHHQGVIPGDLSPCFYPNEASGFVLGYMNSSVAEYFINLINPALTKAVGDVAKIPIPILSTSTHDAVIEIVDQLVMMYRDDWDSLESSVHFQGVKYPYRRSGKDGLQEGYKEHMARCAGIREAAKALEQKINQLIAIHSGMREYVSCDVSDDRISLFANPAYRCSSAVIASEQLTAFRTASAKDLLSYSIGCMMGRYSLDEPGLIYAHGGNIGFDAIRYKTFPADADGIIPITDELWFEDDAANRIREFLLAVWPAPTFEENMAWLAESLGIKGNETPDETIRRHLASSFFKDHLQTYKKRPIYWLFSSGKQGAFQALVYLHRYHEGTLARIRAEYVVPLTGKMQSRIEMLEKDKDAATSTAARNRIARQIESLKKKHVELLAYDEKLRHYADMRISLDLDDGVKVNYRKFGDLLAEVKAVTGGASDD